MLLRRLMVTGLAIGLALGPTGSGLAGAFATGVDDGPYTTLEDQPLTVSAPGVLGNDTKMDPGLQLCASAWYPPSKAGASVVGNADGSFTYTPMADDFGPDTFEYGVSEYNAELDPCPEGGDDKGRVTIDVTPVNDPGTIVAGPDCSGAAITIAEDAGPQSLPNCVHVDTFGPGEDQAVLRWIASIPDADSELFSGAPPAVSLTGPYALTFTPAANAHGTTTITVILEDDGGTENLGRAFSNPLEIALTITSVNDPPTAAADSFTVLKDRTLNVAAPGVLLNDDDIDGSALSAVKVSNPSHGLVTLAADGSFSYTPTAGYAGPDAFSYRASDGSLSSPTRVVSFAVTAVPTPIPTVAPTPVPTAVPTPVPTPVETVEPSPSAEASPSLEPTAAPGETAVPTIAASPTPASTPAPAPTDEGGGVSLPVLLVIVLFVLLVGFGAALYAPKWLAAQRGQPPKED